MMSVRDNLSIVSQINNELNKDDNELFYFLINCKFKIVTNLKLLIQ